jgi:hypothetical protein
MHTVLMSELSRQWVIQSTEQERKSKRYPSEKLPLRASGVSVSVIAPMQDSLSVK